MFRFAVMLLVAFGPKSPAHAQKQQDPDETLAGVLMRNGLLCSRVVDKRPVDASPNQLEVTCIKYREGSRRVRYLLDISTGKASKAHNGPEYIARWRASLQGFSAC
jgi:hypothetical protein